MLCVPFSALTLVVWWQDIWLEKKSIPLIP